MVANLVAAGITVPEDVTDALNRAKFRPTSLPGTREAEAKVAAATTQDEYDSAVADLVLALSVANVDQTRIYGTLNRIGEDQVTGTIRPHIFTLFEEITTTYNAAAPAFTEAVERIPDLTGVNPLDVSPDVSVALQDAKTAVAPLHALWNAYQGLARLLTGRDEFGKTPRSASVIVARLGVVSEDQAEEAVRLIVGYAHNDRDLSLHALAPHVAIPRSGGRLDLVTPFEADTRHIPFA
ncbi:hypothetical protein ACL02T_15305 [Pseudonocardia sp. RS010]|uniref:hypothetical protein n=1 Tax=Pseudonocardia sp. RS010 TaxID=3385979 RepID=UPI0039A03D18